jgi:hypothetical protein
VPVGGGGVHDPGRLALPLDDLVRVQRVNGLKAALGILGDELSNPLVDGDVVLILLISTNQLTQYEKGPAEARQLKYRMHDDYSTALLKNPFIFVQLVEAKVDEFIDCNQSVAHASPSWS